MAGQKTVPMSDYFSLFIVSSDFIQIGQVGGHLKANMMYYHIYLYHGSKYNYYCVITQTLQNGQTLGQFFELLYGMLSPIIVPSNIPLLSNNSHASNMPPTYQHVPTLLAS